MDSRREFIKKATFLSGAAGFLGVLPDSIQKALAIDPAPGTTYLDAEHVVILMQENRSFDHSYGMLRGVRGFNDPRAIKLPNDNVVWLQTNAFGETYVPFRLNMKESKATWMGSLPHSWPNQVDARNKGMYDKWLIAKQPGHKDYQKMPLTQGYYNRDDIPFYYALADAFTVCDQNFCSSLTGTTPNRLYLWTGTVREKPEPESYANIRNENVTDDNEASWTTFPERLEDHGVSWKIYQNELSINTGFTGEEDSWLANFTDNPIEWFKQYNIRFHTGYQKYLAKKLEAIPKEARELQAKLRSLPAGSEEIKNLQNLLDEKGLLYEFLKAELKEWSPENFSKLSQRQKNIHQKAYTINSNDPDYRSITTVKYLDGDIEHEAKAPQGDVLHQFRSDVKGGQLPTVSWLVAPENFSDHPGAPWFGAWYVSEVLDILTQNPEVWKKTVFILCYDENDGYFDHVPPFVVPHPYKENTGKVSQGIDTKEEFVKLEHDMIKKERKESRESPIGLGFRVPLVLASPWNRGGNVCSEVFDHTSILQFLEKFVSHKTGKEIKETNISEWRRTICGDLTSTFKPYDGGTFPLPKFLERKEFMESIHNAQYRKLPSGFKVLSKEEIEQVNRNPLLAPLMPKQEKGTRPSLPLPYELYAEGSLNTDKKAFEIKFNAGNDIFGKQSAGSPFVVYSNGKYDDADVRIRNYAVKAGDQLEDSWPLNDFDNQQYHLKVYGPNGFFREFSGDGNTTVPVISCRYQLDKNKKPTGKIELHISLPAVAGKATVTIKDNAYKAKNQSRTIQGGTGTSNGETVILTLDKSHNWYDFTVRMEGNTRFFQRYAGHVETGRESQSDPLMGQVI
ncbi:hypothetical protein DYBT9275_01978 [Dyadobacter sp. CECT 9275]|uniref:phospholipase C n=1 Tax=Dyadobacter helix TaxID=2822344 RepID=A0A916JBP4_9BACT|nr:phospholipase C, phosphocholine-specific [Dyadobacter sp. CECT 9275]CAG4998328.1 hypothetical protein DYBT9275_01978 [Dyadobacter sp. CECT 9275]